MRSTSILLATAVGLSVAFSSVSSAEAAKLTLNLDTEIVSMDLSGTSAIPLARDPGNALGDSIEGYGFVNTDVTATESATQTSTALTSIVIDTADPANPLISIDSSLTLFLDLLLTDVDDRPGRDFAPGLGSPLAIAADPSQPITVDLSSAFSVTLSDLLSGALLTDLGTVQSASTYVIPLDVDINDNVELDVMKLTANSFDFLIDDLLLTDITISDADLLDFLNGNDVTIDVAASLAITSSSLTFDGQVLDAIVDPPFTLDLNGPTNGAVVPEPSTFALFGIGGIALVGYGWRRKRQAA